MSATNNYTFGGGDEPPSFGPKPAGDYDYTVTEAQEPYLKDNGNWVMPVRLAIQPDGMTVFANPWSGKTKAGETRDGIGNFLVSCNRAPAKVGETPDWDKVVGARGRVRLKVVTAGPQSSLAGKEVNEVAFFHSPKDGMKFTEEEKKEYKAPPTQPDADDDVPY